MIGKKNVVFGFLYLVFTASLGPYMVVELLPDVRKAELTKQRDIGRLQQLRTNNFEEELEPLDAGQIAKANTSGILALNGLANAEQLVDAVKGGAHAHGNLEALLNVAAGLALCFIGVAAWFKQLVSWLFIAGALLHSGMLYLLLLGQSWAGTLLMLGPWLVLASLLLIGIAAAVGFRGELVRDD